MPISAEELRQLVHYDPDTGIFTWLQSKFQPYRIGKRAGSKMSNGYRRIFIGEKAVTEHRLAWLYMTGKWPQNHIDHINGDRTDNRFCNLRDVSRSTNLHNIARANKNASSKYRGVSPANGTWTMQILVNGKRIRVPGFSTEEDAARCYLAVKSLINHQ